MARHDGRSDRARLIVGALAIGILAIGLLLLLNQTGPGTSLGSLPEARLRPPDSEPLADGSRDRVDDVLGTTNAAWWTIFGTDASLEQVRGFYDTKLTDLGWRVGSRVGSTDEIETYSWTRDHLRFRLGFKRTTEWYQRLEGSDRFPTLFEIRVIEREPPE